MPLIRPRKTSHFRRFKTPQKSKPDSEACSGEAIQMARVDREVEEESPRKYPPKVQRWCELQPITRQEPPNRENRKTNGGKCDKLSRRLHQTSLYQLLRQPQATCCETIGFFRLDQVRFIHIMMLGLVDTWRCWSGLSIKRMDRNRGQMRPLRVRSLKTAIQDR